jgi:hypothetical protein
MSLISFEWISFFQFVNILDSNPNPKVYHLIVLNLGWSSLFLLFFDKEIGEFLEFSVFKGNFDLFCYLFC